MILSRQSHPPEDPFESETQLLSERLAEAALLEDDDEDGDIVDSTIPTAAATTNSSANDNSTVADGEAMEDVPQQVVADDGISTTEANNKTNTKKNCTEIETSRAIPMSLLDPTLKERRPEAAKSKKKKKKPKKTPPPPPPVELPASTTDALQALPAQEVSITARTQVKLTGDPTSTSTTIGANGTNKTTASNSRGSKGSNSNRKKEPKKAARKFNQQIRQCVEDGDPDTMRRILEDNHSQYALDASVLETVLKAYTVAAMFEDALFCLRYCTKPDTLQTTQLQRILECLPQNLRNTNNYVAADMIAALCIATHFDTPNARTYALRVIRNACFEFLQEAMSSRDRICSASADRLAAAGVCFRNVRLERHRQKKDSLAVLDVAQPLDPHENRGIQAGDAVSILPYAGPYPMSAESLDRNMIEAVVVAVVGNSSSNGSPPVVLRLSDKMSPAVMEALTDPAARHRIDKLANRMGLNRQLAAAVAMAAPDNNNESGLRPCREMRQAVTAMEAAVHASSSSSLTSSLCGQAVNWWEPAQASDDLATMDEEAIRAHARNELERTGALEGLNYSQQLAVEGATTNRLTLVQGPPGTLLIVEDVVLSSGKPWLTFLSSFSFQARARRALPFASSNTGPRLRAPIRTAPSWPRRIPTLRSITWWRAVPWLGCGSCAWDGQKRFGPSCCAIALIVPCRRTTQRRVTRNASSNSRMVCNILCVWQVGVAPFRECACRQFACICHSLCLFAPYIAQIICCTCIGSGGDILDGLGPLERVLVDEATQATEAAVLVPLMRGCKQLVLVGDHCQLPPTVLSTRAEEEGHGVPLFSRMVACGVPPYMLDTQVSRCWSI